MAPRAVLVTGGTGAVGPALVERLLREGLAVRVLSRHAPAELPEGATHIGADAADSAAVRTAVEGCAYVFHLAARLHVPSPAPGRRAEFERANVGAVRLVAEAAAKGGVERLVHFSTVSVYGPTAGTIADEDTPPHPLTLYAETKLRGEGEALACRSSAGAPLATVLRLAAVYGPHVRGHYRTLAKTLRAGWFIPVGAGTNRRTLVHEADVAEAAWRAATHPAAAGRVFNVTDGSVHTLSEIIAAICRALGRRPPAGSLPTVLARAVATLLDAPLRLAGRGRPLGAALATYLEDVAVSGERMLRELGYAPRFDLEAGWRDALG